MVEREDEDERAQRAILDLAKAEANLRQALLARSIEGVDHVAAAEGALAEARAVFERVAHPKPRTVTLEREVKSWGSH